MLAGTSKTSSSRGSILSRASTRGPSQAQCESAAVDAAGNGRSPKSEVSKDDSRPHNPSSETVNPRGIPGQEYKQKVESWVQQEQTYSDRVDGRYKPIESGDGDVPLAHLHKAAEEFRKREQVEDLEVPPVLLVATGVKPDWGPPEGAPKARFLIVPKVRLPGDAAEEVSALFLTYMPGVTHGAADAYVTSILENWKNAKATTMDALMSGQSSGSNDACQPDFRIFPKRRNRDPIGDDSDRTNEMFPYSRIIWEIEYASRNPQQTRQRGREYFNENPYLRCFLAAKVFQTTPQDTNFQAAIVLWRKDDNGTAVRTVRAVDFGTAPMSDRSKEEFTKGGSSPDLLAPISSHRFKRPETEEEWMLKIPFRDILFKVAVREDQGRDPENPYILPSLTDKDKPGDLSIDLRKLSRIIQDVVDGRNDIAASEASARGQKRKTIEQ